MTLVEMFAKCGNITKALQVLHEIPDRNELTYTAIIGGLALHTQDALSYFLEMIDVGVTSDEVGVLSACCLGGLVEEGRKIFYQMSCKFNIPPKIKHYCCMVALLDPQKHRVGRAAMKLLDLDPDDKGIYVLLANMYVEANTRDKAGELRKMMREREVDKTPGCSSIEPEVGSSGWKSTTRRVVSSAPPTALEYPKNRVPSIPVAEGGLGIRSLTDYVKAFSMKLWWRFRSKSSLWSEYLHGRYCRNLHPTIVLYNRNHSPVWHRLCRIRDVAEPFLFWTLGEGFISFWHDNWLGEKSLAQLLHRDTYTMEPVSYYWHEGDWNVLRTVLGFFGLSPCLLHRPFTRFLLQHVRGIRLCGQGLARGISRQNRHGRLFDRPHLSGNFWQISGTVPCG
ncbi:Pentatricopeptide repeat-containing protein, mitochondrial [Sesamum angolense]|uniref:Pentatricopeptide repeat-containing protein, mitochondrial n=1 Tax=Sesamum angolense TaxID=2727404 RepID=A0AAE1T5X0_9LAMI|nr:Pentatricopeptide repeat-containing protein, mitochondrial [Sesamum angolense]